jgi:NAD(P)H-flavin reductase
MGAARTKIRAARVNRLTKAIANLLNDKPLDELARLIPHTGFLPVRKHRQAGLA